MRIFDWLTARVLLAAFILGLSGAVYAANYVWEGEATYKIFGAAFVSAKYVKDPAGKVSGNKVLKINKVAQGKKTPKGTAYYNVNVPQAGTYYLWARTRWENGCGNSFLMSVDGIKGDYILGGDGTYNSLHWVRLNNGTTPLAMKLKKGPTIFTLKSKESGTMVDQFYLTTDKVSVPASYYTPTPNLLVTK